jgi:hypothetical protein
MTAIGVQTYQLQKYSGMTEYSDDTAASLAAPSRKRPASVVVPRKQEPMQSEPQSASPPIAGEHLNCKGNGRNIHGLFSALFGVLM